MGVWNGWGYGIAFFPALIFAKFRSLNLAKIDLSVEFKAFPGNFGL